MSKRNDGLKGTEILSAATYTGRKDAGYTFDAETTISNFRVNGVDSDVKTTYFLNGLVCPANSSLFMPNGQWVHDITFTGGPITAVKY